MPPGQCGSAQGPIDSRRLFSRISAMVLAEPFFTGRASLHLVKWSDNTKMLVLPLGVEVSGPTKSMESTCQGRPACSLCLFLFRTGLLCLTGWHASHEFTSWLVPSWLSFQCHCAPVCGPPTPLASLMTLDTTPATFHLDPLVFLSLTTLPSPPYEARGSAI